MQLLTPLLWKKKNCINVCLLPLAFIYYATQVVRRLFTKSYKPSIPVICVGNATAGGAGKTPFCIALGKLLKAHYSVAYVSRGYGGSEQGPVQVTSGHHYKQVGDEPLLLQKMAPVFVAKNRRLAIDAAIASGAQLVIMDDGLQNPTIAKTLSFLVIDGSTGVGNGYVIPAGPLRLPLKDTLKKSDAVVMMGQDRTQITASLKNKPLIEATIVPASLHIMAHKKMIAFAGIGHPEKFFHTLETLNYKILEQISFADHYAYKKQDLDKLLAKAKKENAILITTEKDMMRIPFNYQRQIHSLPIEVVFDKTQEEELLKLIAKKIP
jgi:tetraacyldisaccharide 4'-kinase